jgi:hypothetical protein
MTTDYRPFAGNQRGIQFISTVAAEGGGKSLKASLR